MRLLLNKIAAVALSFLILFTQLPAQQLLPPQKERVDWPKTLSQMAQQADIDWVKAFNLPIQDDDARERGEVFNLLNKKFYDSQENYINFRDLRFYIFNALNTTDAFSRHSFPFAPQKDYTVINTAHAYARFLIHHASNTKAFKQYNIHDSAPKGGYRPAPGVISELLYVIENYGLDDGAVNQTQAFMRDFIKMAPKYCASSQNECLTASKAIIILSLITGPASVDEDAKTIYAALARSYHKQYGPMLIIPSAAALISFDTEASFQYIRKFLTKDSLPVGTVWETAKSYLGELLDLITVSGLVRHGIGATNKIRGGAGMYLNNINVKLQYIDEDAALEDGRSSADIFNAQRSSVLEQAYQLPYRNIMEDIGIMLSAAQSDRAKKLADRFLAEYQKLKKDLALCAYQTNKQSIIVGNNCAINNFIHIPLIVGLLQGGNTNPVLTVDIAKQINSNDWWDLNEGTQRRINNAPLANKYSAFLPKITRDELKLARAQDNERLLDMAMWGDMAVCAAFVSTLIYNLPAIARNGANFAAALSKYKNINKAFKISVRQRHIAAAKTGAARSVAKTSTAQNGIKQTPEIEQKAVNNIKLQKESEIANHSATAEIKKPFFEYTLETRNNPSELKINNNLTVSIGEGGGGGVNAVSLPSGTAQRAYPPLPAKSAKLKAVAIKNPAVNRISAKFRAINKQGGKTILQPVSVNKPNFLKTSLINLQINAEIIKESLFFSLKPSSALAMLPLGATSAESAGLSTIAIYRQLDGTAKAITFTNLLKQTAANPVLTGTLSGNIAPVLKTASIPRAISNMDKLGTLLGVYSLPKLNIILNHPHSGNSSGGSLRGQAYRSTPADKNQLLLKNIEGEVFAVSPFAKKVKDTRHLNAAIEAKQGSVKTMYLLGGLNGSGKSTIANKVFSQYGIEFIDPDAMVAQISDMEDPSKDLRAWKQVVTKLNDIIKSGKTFAIETTMGGIGYTKTVKQAKEDGYQVVMIFLFLDNPQLSIARIKGCVAKGGHAIPDKVVKDRFHRTRDNFWNKYKDLSDEWFLFYNGGKDFVPVAEGRGPTTQIINRKLFKMFYKEVPKQ